MEFRKLDDLEDEMNRTALGRKVLDIFRVHAEEVMILLNQHRAVKVVWHRNHGPEFIAYAVKSGFEEDYRVPSEIQGVSMVQLLRRMASVLQEVGTPALKKVIGERYFLVMSWAQRCNSLRDVMNEIASLDADAPTSMN
jgi:hypothetical protein